MTDVYAREIMQMVCKKNCKSAAANDYEKMVLIITDDISEISFPINMSFSSVKK